MTSGRPRSARSHGGASRARPGPTPRSSRARRWRRSPLLRAPSGVFVYWPLVQNFGRSASSNGTSTAAAQDVRRGRQLRRAASTTRSSGTSLGNNAAVRGDLDRVPGVRRAPARRARSRASVANGGGKASGSIYFIPSAISLTVAGLLFYFIYQPQTAACSTTPARSAGARPVRAGMARPRGHRDASAIIAMSQWQGFGYIDAAVRRWPSSASPRDSTRRPRSTGSARSGRFFSVTIPLVREMTGADDDRHDLRRFPGVQRGHGDDRRRARTTPRRCSGHGCTAAGFIPNDFGYAAAIGDGALRDHALLAVAAAVGHPAGGEWNGDVA